MSFSDRRPRRSTFVTALAATVLLALIIGFMSAAAPASTPSPAANGAAQVQAGSAAAKCTALIQKGKKLVAVYERVYKYKFVKVKGSKSFQRKIVRVRQKLRIRCVPPRRCVTMKKKKGRLRPVYVIVKKKVLVPKRGKLVKVTKRVRTYKFSVCKLKQGGTSLGTPVTISMLDDARAILDFGAFVREAPVRGSLKGYVPGGIKLGTDFQIILTSGTLKLDPTAVFIDDDCNGQVSAAIRTGDPTNVALNKARTSTSTVLADGTVTATAYVDIRVPLELRNDDTGCNSPYITTGYSSFPMTFFLKGKLDPKAALSRVKLTSAPDLTDVPVCLSPGLPTEECNGFEIPLPIQISTQLYISVKLN